jgi:hypothetical protein
VGSAEAGRAKIEGTLLARGADLLAGCTPFTRAEITHAFDRILAQLGSAERGLAAFAPPAITLPGLAGTAVVVAGALVIRQRLRARDEETEGDAEEGEDLSVFPVLPSRRQRLALEEL